MLMCTSLFSQQIRLRDSFIQRDNATLWDLTEQQSSSEGFLNNPLNGLGGKPASFSLEYLRDTYFFPDSLTVMGETVTAIPESLEASAGLVSAVFKFIRSESIQTDAVYYLDDFEVLNARPNVADPVTLIRVSGEKRFHVPQGVWVWEYEQGGNRGRVRARIRALAPLIRAGRTIIPGEEITRDKVKLQFTDLTQIAIRPMTAQDLVKPWTAKTAFRSGDWIHTRDLSLRHPVTAQNPVNVVVSRRGVALFLDAVAMDSGMAGDRVRVRLNLGGKTLLGIVTAEGEVLVESL